VKNLEFGTGFRNRWPEARMRDGVAPGPYRSMFIVLIAITLECVARPSRSAASNLGLDWRDPRTFHTAVHLSGSRSAPGGALGEATRFSVAGASDAIVLA